jgi:hypothetical protein
MAQVIRPVGRLGGISYSRLGDMFEIPRPKFEEVKKEEDNAHFVSKVEGQ